jgi:uncharacterized membrane protein
MSAEFPKGVRNPDWEILIAHHFPNRYRRTLELRIGELSYHFCARCSGQLLGFLTILSLFLVSPSFGILLSAPISAVTLGVGPSLPTADWLTQTVRSRESNNYLRVVTGITLGAAFGGLVVYGLSQHWLLFLSSLAMLGFYTAFTSLVLYRTGSLRGVVADHFP